AAHTNSARNRYPSRNTDCWSAGANFSVVGTHHIDPQTGPRPPPLGRCAMRPSLTASRHLPHGHRGQPAVAAREHGWLAIARRETRAARNRATRNTSYSTHNSSRLFLTH